MAILQTRELKKYYGAGDTLVKALDGVELESVRLENGAAVLTLRGERGAAWLSSVPLAQLGIHGQPWRGSARPGALYTEYLGGGWYAGYACLGWR